MEQAYSATSLGNLRLLLGSASNRGALSGTWPRDHHAQTSLVLGQTAPFSGQNIEPNQEAQEAPAISPVDIASTEHSNLVAEVPVNTPILDYSHASHEELLAAARFSDGRAFVELSGRCADSVHSRVFRILRNREDTEDVVQEALFKAYTHIGEFRGSCTFSTWLTKIAINSALMLLRKRRSRSEVSFDQPGDNQTRAIWEFPDPYPNAEQVYAKRQIIDLLSHAIKRLPSCYRSILESHHGREQSVQETADALGITVAAAKSRLLRARLTVRSTLEEKVSPCRTHAINKAKTVTTDELLANEIRERQVITQSQS